MTAQYEAPVSLVIEAIKAPSARMDVLEEGGSEFHDLPLLTAACPVTEIQNISDIV